MSYFQDKIKINLISNTNWYKLTAFYQLVVTFRFGVGECCLEVFQSSGITSVI